MEETPGDAPDICISCFEAIMELGMSSERFQRLMEKRALQIKDKANGFYTRNVDTSLGSFQNVRVPRLRKESLSTVWFRRYQRRWQKVDRLLLQCLVGGLSARRAVKIMNRHFHWGLSPSTISRLSGMLTEAPMRFRHCPLTDDYIGLIIDGGVVSLSAALWA